MNLPPPAAACAVTLLRGPIYRDRDAAHWQALEAHLGPIRDYLAVIGLELHQDTADGFAFLRQRAVDPDAESELPRLIASRPLAYDLSLLLVTLRGRLVDIETWGGDARATVSRGELVEQLAVFFPAERDDTRFARRIDTLLNKAVELGVLRKMRSDVQSGDSGRYEVRMVIKALVDADWLGGVRQALDTYRAHAESADDA